MEQLASLLTTFLPTLMPLASAGITFVLVAGIKKFEAVQFSENKKSILRTFAAALSFLSVTIMTTTSGGSVDQNAVSQFVDILINSGLGYIGATGINDLKNR